MSDDVIHNPSAATNEQTEIMIEKQVEQPTMTENPVTENPAEITNETTSGHMTTSSGGAREKTTSHKNERALNEHTTGPSMENTASYQPSYQTGQYQTNQPSARRAPGRPSLKMTKEQLMAAITEITEKLGHVPSYAELMKTGKVSGRQIVKHFATYTRALRACNLERVCGEQAAAGKAVSGLGNGDAATGQDSQPGRVRADGPAQRHAAEDTVWKLGPGPALSETLH